MLNPFRSCKSCKYFRESIGSTTVHPNKTVTKDPDKYYCRAGSFELKDFKACKGYTKPEIYSY